MMELNLKCLEWINMNKNARLIKTNKNKNKKKSIDSSNSLYLIQITGFSNINSKLACLSSDQIINIYDQQNLKLLNQIKSTSNKDVITNEIGFFKQSDNMVFSCSDDGNLKCWDLRNFSIENNIHSESICFSCTAEEKREFLSSDINLDDNLFVVGTNKNIDDALIYIFDIRYNQKYLHKFSESHSNDITQVKFNPSKSSKFSSGSLDGLVCLYDLNQEPEITLKDHNNESDKEKDESESESEESGEEDPDFMEQILNTDSSIQKLGYISSTCSTADQLYAITFTNDLFVWDLNTYDFTFKHQSKNKNILNGKLINDMDNQEEDYFFDVFYNKENFMTICKGDKNGNLKLFKSDNSILFDGSLSDNKNDSKRNHRDIIRSSYWNNEYFFTAGEDGFLFKWKLNDSNEQDLDEKQAIKRDREEEIINESDQEQTLQKEEEEEIEPKRNKKSNNFYFKNKKNKKKQNKNFK